MINQRDVFGIPRPVAVPADTARIVTMRRRSILLFESLARARP